MANANVTFTIRELSYGVNPESPPAERRLRLGYSIYANVSGQGSPPILADDELILEISLSNAEKLPNRFPRIVATDDVSPKGEPNGKVHTASLRAKSLDPLFQGWHVEAEVPLLFEKTKTTYVSTKLTYQGKSVASTKAREWNAIQLNPTQSVVKKLAQGSQRFPCLSSQICISHRTVVSKDLAGYDYTGTSNDLSRLADITEEISARLAQGLDPVWREAEAKADQSTLYNGFRLEEREARAFGNKKGQDINLFGTLEEQQIAVANEVWARAITELVCFTPYRSTGSVYYNGERATTKTVGGANVQSTIEYDLADGVSGRASEPYFPIAHACQQLVTLALLSRGWSIEAPPSSASPVKQIALAAGSRSAVFYSKFLKPDPGTWVPYGKTQGEVPNFGDLSEDLIKWLNPTTEKATPDASALVMLSDANGATAFGPGSIAVFANGFPQDHGLQVDNLDGPPRRVARNPAEVAANEAYLAWQKANPNEMTIPKGLRKEKPSEVRMYGANLDDNSGAAHIGCILRVDRTTKRYQVLDTGALNTGADYGIWRSMPGIGDYPETRGNMHSLKDPSRGIGLAPILTASKADTLYQHVRKVLQVSRPLGFMRLVVARRDIAMSFDNVNQWLLYASPLLRMYGNNPVKGNRAAYADLVWSLRDFPKRDQLRLIWSVRVPRLQLADTMLTEPRSSGVFELVTKTM